MVLFVILPLVFHLNVWHLRFYVSIFVWIHSFSYDSVISAAKVTSLFLFIKSSMFAHIDHYICCGSQGKCASCISRGLKFSCDFEIFHVLLSFRRFCFRKLIYLHESNGDNSFKNKAKHFLCFLKFNGKGHNTFENVLMCGSEKFVDLKVGWLQFSCVYFRVVYFRVVYFCVVYFCAVYFPFHSFWTERFFHQI